MDRIAARGGVSLRHLGGGRSGEGGRDGVARFFSGASAGAFWLLGLAGAVVTLWQSLRGRWEGRKLALASMLIKLFHIQNYIVLFLGAMFLFAIPMVPVLIWVVDVLTIFLSGLVGLAAVFRCRVEGRLSNRTAVVNGILQFLFCVDIFSAIWVYRNTKEAFLS